MIDPRRGEVWLLDLGPGGKIRPAVVLHVPYEDHERALLAMVPPTTNLRGTRFEVAAGAPFLKVAALDAQGLAEPCLPSGW